MTDTPLSPETEKKLRGLAHKNLLQQWMDDPRPVDDGFSEWVLEQLRAAAVVAVEGMQKYFMEMKVKYEAERERFVKALTDRDTELATLRNQQDKDRAEYTEIVRYWTSQYEELQERLRNQLGGQPHPLANVYRCSGKHCQAAWIKRPIGKEDINSNEARSNGWTVDLTADINGTKWWCPNCSGEPEGRDDTKEGMQAEIDHYHHLYVESAADQVELAKKLDKAEAELAAIRKYPAKSFQDGARVGYDNAADTIAELKSELATLRKQLGGQAGPEKRVCGGCGKEYAMAQDYCPSCFRNYVEDDPGHAGPVEKAPEPGQPGNYKWTDKPTVEKVTVEECLERFTNWLLWLDAQDYADKSGIIVKRVRTDLTQAVAESVAAERERLAAKIQKLEGHTEEAQCGEEAACAPGGNYGLCKTHPTCEMVRRGIDELNRRILAERERHAAELAKLSVPMEIVSKAVARAKAEAWEEMAKIAEKWEKATEHDDYGAYSGYSVATGISDDVRKLAKRAVSEKDGATSVMPAGSFSEYLSR